MWYIYTVEYYLAVRKNGIMKFVGKWIDLGKITLSEVTQTWKEKNKTKHYMFFLIYSS